MWMWMWMWMCACVCGCARVDVDVRVCVWMYACVDVRVCEVFSLLSFRSDRRRGARAFETLPHSENAGDELLVRAVICAGTSPNVAVIDAGKSRPSFRTHVDGKVEPHPSSVVSDEKAFQSRFLVYSSKMKTSNVYLSMVTCVPEYAILLLGGAVRQGAAKNALSMFDGTVQFKLDSASDAQLILRARAELAALLGRKAEEPGLDMDLAGGALVAVVRQLLAESSRGRGKR